MSLLTSAVSVVQACLVVLDLLPLLFVVWLSDIIGVYEPICEFTCTFHKILTVNVLGAHHEHISKHLSSRQKNALNMANGLS